MRFDSQLALVCGGASGMGQATAQYLKHKGMKVVVWDKQDDKESLSDLTVNCDVRIATSIETAMAETLQKFGTAPRVCVNCAGIAPAKRIVGKNGAMPLDAFKEVIDINLIGTFNVMRVVAHAMSTLEPEDSLERGVIINTASIAAYDGQVGQAAYSASKGGIVSMTLPAARELAQFGIRVNTIAPGLIATPLLLNMPQEVQDNLVADLIFPKRFGKPDEFSSLVGHIVENTMLNGEVIRLDGALRMR